jgi:hypothetical protein
VLTERFRIVQCIVQDVRRSAAAQDILTADQQISAGNYHTLDDLQAALEERQRQENSDA